MTVSQAPHILAPPYRRPAIFVKRNFDIFFFPLNTSDCTCSAAILANLTRPPVTPACPATVKLFQVHCLSQPELAAYLFCPGDCQDAALSMCQVLPYITETEESHLWKLNQILDSLKPGFFIRLAEWGAVKTPCKTMAFWDLGLAGQSQSSGAAVG